MPLPGSSGRSLSHQDFVYFDYFRRTTAPSTDSIIPSNFWSEVLLQLAHTEPAIWHATNALGALHRRWELESAGMEVDGLIHNATTHYGKALSLAKDLNSPAKILALSLPLIASANMLGFWDESHIHILSAFKILAQDSGRTPDAQRMASTLTRMDIQSLTFGDVRTPYPYAEAAALRSINQAMINTDASIKSYSQASSTIFALVRQVTINYEIFFDGSIDEATYNSMFRELLEKTEQLERQLAKFEAEDVRLGNESAAIVIRIYHCWLRTVFKCTLDGLESRFDRHLGFLQRLITLSYAVMKQQHAPTSLQLSLEPALVAPLFGTANRCRHPALRRHGLKLLKEMNRHEGMWRSDGAALIVEEIIAIEEKGERGGGAGYDDEMLAGCKNYCALHAVQDEALAVSWDAWSSEGYEPPTNYSWLEIRPIPEERRVKAVMAAWRFESREMDIEFKMSSPNPEQRYGSSNYVTIKV
ncbi:unnamed protein product [Clonostachys solani]|uniref:Uncharacterized protein n=1 Tax=Clonostachys solani TaxID=160281 RepID=A0A9N9ZK00_9HYPO|nr:unnamed protein product [Clonostachys solani]